MKDIIEALRGCPSSTTSEAMVELASSIRFEHRTHQANIVRNLLEVLENLSDAPADLRNQGAVEACSKIKELDLFVPYV
jgi:hypothetical protein